MTEVLQMTVVAGSQAEATRIGKGLVDRRQAACVQIVGPVHSIYRWEGNVEQAEEWICVIKTTRDRYAAAEETIRAIHSYRCPEIVATPIPVGSDEYLAWLVEQTRESDDGRSDDEVTG
ncbi:MAG TPA: divalent-cation tolerance protein CutA [Lacipirellulaceae bacterium]|nr:divalent-cation tolerance protein CutA [Lacipirellulaceae bacterium]